MSMHTRVGGAWKQVDALHTKVGGVWKEVISGYIKVSGTWKEFYAAVRYALSGETGINDLQTQPTVARAGIRINADGTIDKRVGGVYTQIDSATDWGVPNAKITGLEEFFCTDNNANIDGTSDATGSWEAAPLEWFVANATAIPKLLDLTVQVRSATGEPAADSGNYTGTATSEL